MNDMGEISDYYVENYLSKMPNCGNIQDRPDTKGISKDSLKWFTAIVTGECSRDIGSEIFVAFSPNPKFYYVKKKKGIGTINIKKVQLKPCQHAGAGIVPNKDNSCPICGDYCIPF